MKRSSFAAAALICAAMLLCLGCAQKAPDTEARKYENSIGYYYTPEDTSSRFFVNGELLEDKLGGEVEAFLTCDGTVGIARVGSGLYRVDGSGVLMVYPAGVDRAVLSLDGDTIAFTTATEVHIYRRGTEELASVKAEDCASILSLALSPDGGTVGYTVKSPEGALTAWAWSGGDNKRLSDNAYIVGAADGAEYWYYLTPEAELYYAKADSQRKIGEQCASVIEFNRDLTEVLFDMNGETYFSKNGGSAKRIEAGASMLTTAGECFVTQGGSDCTVYVKDCATMFDCVFYDYMAATSGDNTRTVYHIWYVDAGGRAKELVNGAYQFSISEGGERLTCLVDSELYCMKVSDRSSAEVIANNVYSYIASTDLSVIYCVGYDLGFYRIREFGSPELLAENAVYCLLTDGGECLFIADYDETGTLYIAGPEGAPQKAADSVYMAETSPRFACYYSAPYEDAEGRLVADLYVSPDGHGFKLALKGVKINAN